VTTVAFLRNGREVLSTRSLLQAVYSNQVQSTQVYGAGPTCCSGVWLMKRRDVMESIPSFYEAPLSLSVRVTYYGDGDGDGDVDVDGDVFEHPMPPGWRCHEQ
jgi:hypothetical protein